MLQSLCHCHYGWQLWTFLVLSALWLATRNYSSAVVAMAGNSELFLRHHRPCSITKVVSRAFGRGHGGHPSSDVLSSLHSFGVMLCQHRMLVDLPVHLEKACAIVALAQRERHLRTCFWRFQLCSK
eukprot:scaffold59112_cov33-Attheya_sp.AAC.2